MPIETSGRGVAETLELIKALTARGVRFWLADDQLKFRAAPGIMSPDLLDSLRSRREEIVGALKEIAALQERARSRPIVGPMEPADRIPITHRWDVWEYAARGGFAVDFTNIVLLLHVNIEIDGDEFLCLIDLLRRRHDMLRAYVEVIDGVPMFSWVPEFTVMPRIVDLSSEPDETLSETFHSTANQFCWTPLHMEKEPWRTCLIKLPKSQSVIGIVAHHLFCDSHSADALGLEVEKYFRSPGLHGELAMAPRPLQYSEYSRTMDEWLAGAGAKPEFDFWRDKLKGFTGIWLPDDFTSEDDRPHNTDLVPFLIGAETCEAVGRVCASHSATLVMAVLAAEALALARLARSEDVVIWTYEDCRAEGEFDGVVGMFIEDIPYRLAITPEMTSLDVLLAVRRTWIDVEPNRHLTVRTLRQLMSDSGVDLRAPALNYRPEYSSILEEGPHVRGVGGVAVASTDCHFTRFGYPPPEFTEFLPDVPFCFSMHASEQEGGIAASVRYSTARYRRETIERFVGEVMAAFSDIARS